MEEFLTLDNISALDKDSTILFFGNLMIMINW